MEKTFLSISREPDNKGLYYYLLPKGTKLYRGDTGMYLQHKNDSMITLNDHPTFFTLDSNSAEEKYGVLYEFTTNMEIYLLALDHIETIRELYNHAPPYIKTVLEKNYGYKSGSRYSSEIADKKLVDYLCQKGFNGYATDEMPTDFDTFHNEIVLCNLHVLDDGHLVSEQKKIPDLVQKHKDSEEKKKREQQRKEKKSHSSQEDSLDFPPVKNLFGFGGKMKSRSKKSQKKSKTRKNKTRSHRKK